MEVEKEEMEEEEEKGEGEREGINESIKAMVLVVLGVARPVPNCVISLSLDLAIFQLDLHSVTLSVTMVNTSKLTQPVPLSSPRVDSAFRNNKQTIQQFLLTIFS